MYIYVHIYIYIHTYSSHAASSCARIALETKHGFAVVHVHARQPPQVVCSIDAAVAYFLDVVDGALCLSSCSLVKNERTRCRKTCPLNAETDSFPSLAVRNLVFLFVFFCFLCKLYVEYGNGFVAFFFWGKKRFLL